MSLYPPRRSKPQRMSRLDFILALLSALSHAVGRCQGHCHLWMSSPQQKYQISEQSMKFTMPLQGDQATLLAVMVGCFSFRTVIAIRHARSLGRIRAGGSTGKLCSQFSSTVSVPTTRRPVSIYYMWQAGLKNFVIVSNKHSSRIRPPTVWGPMLPCCRGLFG
jgi:hypothetical protein